VQHGHGDDLLHPDMQRVIFLLCLFAITSITYAAPLLSGDTDGDGLLDTEEDINGNGILDAGETNPFDADTDGGGEADGAEVRSGRDPLDPKDDQTADPDEDGLINARELLLGTNPLKKDTDGDGIPDGQEIAMGLHPLNPDTDGDGLSDGQEIALGTDPKNPDSDGDGLSDGDDPFPLEKAFTKDTNNNGTPDEWEQHYHFSSNEQNDGNLDTDNDGLRNTEEFIYGTDPRQIDTDHDGISDGQEVLDGTDPNLYECLIYEEDAPTFDDLTGHWSLPYVRHLQHTYVFSHKTPIIEGYKHGTSDSRIFLPDRNISRFELLKIALFSTCTQPKTDDATAPLPFSDVPKNPQTDDGKFRQSILAAAYRLDIVHGYPDNTFRMDDPINRAEALKIFLRAARFIVWMNEERAATPFSDISSDAWFTPYVEQAYGLHFIEGYPDNTFRPDQSITRAEAAKLVYLLLISNPAVNSDVIPTENMGQ